MKSLFRNPVGRLIIMLIVVGLLVGACTPANTETGKSGPTKTSAPVPSTQTSVPTPYESQIPIPAGAAAAQKLLAERLNISIDQINIRQIEQKQWPDACLGLQQPDEMCAVVITDGFQVMMEAQGSTYEAHTDMDGKQVRFAEDAATGATSQPGDVMDGSVLTWTGVEEGICSQIEVRANTVAYGVCGKSTKETTLSPQRTEELAFFEDTYSSFTAKTQDGQVALTGRGDQQASQAEQRSVVEWARLVFLEAQGGRSGAAWGVVLSWHREGGIAGFCDDLIIYSSGWAQPNTCKVGQAQVLDNYRLTPAELKELYAWIDQLDYFEYQQKDAAAADSMEVRVVFSGAGSAQPTPEQQEEIAAFAAEINSRASR
jgi:hypothetical protein